MSLNVIIITGMTVGILTMSYIANYYRDLWQTWIKEAQRHASLGDRAASELQKSRASFIEQYQQREALKRSNDALIIRLQALTAQHEHLDKAYAKLRAKNREQRELIKDLQNLGR